MGVKAETGKVLGKDLGIDALLQQNVDAVFLAAGGWDSRMARGATAEIESPIPGTCMMIDILNPAVKGSETISSSSQVVIFGGAKLALETARICKRAGADKITILYREDLSDSPVADADVEALGIDGLDIVFNAGLHRLRGEADNLSEIDLIDTLTRKISTIPAQALILATGRFPELIFVENNPAGPADGEAAGQSLRWEAFAPYKQPALKDEVGLFAEGDVLADYNAAIKAIGAGRRAAASIQQILYGLDPSLTEQVITPRSLIQNVDHVEEVAASRREIMPICSGRELAACGELERGFSKESAQAEASRCLQCGLICYEHSLQPAREEKAGVEAQA
jgi:NADPH-dependent glutamate synthase beta subunit-like oxidoreductase